MVGTIVYNDGHTEKITCVLDAENDEVTFTTQTGAVIQYKYGHFYRFRQEFMKLGHKISGGYLCYSDEDCFIFDPSICCISIEKGLFNRGGGEFHERR